MIYGIEMKESGVIKLDGKGSKAALVYGQMNEPPGAQEQELALSGLSVAEYFRDEENQDVLLFVLITSLDLLKPVQKCQHYLGRIPSAVGYQPTL